MKTNKITVIILMTLMTQIGFGQVTVDDNLPFGGRYIGFNNFSTIDLPLENNGLRTLFSFENWPGYNSIAAQNNANRIYFPTDPSETQADIFSLIQIGDGINSNFQRDWMHVGITYGAGGDLMYTGIIQDPANAGNQTGGDAVVVWGDNETIGTQGPDNLRFIFMSALNPNNPGAGDDQGLETMRISPQGNVGLGNFSAGNGLAEQPTERLDIDGSARIRQLPSNDTPDVIITGSEVDAVGDYLLTYSTINDLAGIDCRWKDIPSSTISGGTTEDLYTGYDPGSDCYRDKVAVGLKGPQQAKLEVYMLNDELNAFNNPIRNDNVLVGTYSRASTTREENDFVVGVSGVSDCLGNTGVSNAANIGVNGLGADARYAVGVRGEGRATPATGTFVAIGVRGEAGEVGPAGFNIGVYGEVPTGYSGYFVGGLHVTSGTSVPISDESVKTDVSEITNASEILSQLQPKTYYFQSPENREIGFEDGLQYGLIAQEVQEVIPDIVETIKLPAKFDSSGTYDPSTEIELLGIQYGQLIPLLVSAYNEQSTQVAEQAQIISDQEETIEELENQLADLSESLGQLQESVAQLNAVVEQNQAKSNDCCEKISNLMGDAGKLGKQSLLEVTMPLILQG